VTELLVIIKRNVHNLSVSELMLKKSRI